MMTIKSKDIPLGKDTVKIALGERAPPPGVMEDKEYVVYRKDNGQILESDIYKKSKAMQEHERICEQFKNTGGTGGFSWQP